MKSESQSLNYLPVKFLYNYTKKSVQMFYRKKNDHRLYNKYLPHNHYIYTKATENDIDEGKKVFKHLYTGKYFKKEYMEPKTARNLWKNSPDLTAEGDLSPETRFIIDNFYDVTWPSDIKPRIFYFDIETEIVGHSMPTFHNNASEITAFTIYDNYTDTYYMRGLVPKDGNYESSDEVIQSISEAVSEYEINVDIKLFDEPENLLSDLIDFFTDMTPDIITSWNSMFDIPYTVRKIFDHFGEDGLKSISPFKRVSWKVKLCLESGELPDTDLLIPGISTIDDLMLYKQNSEGEKPSYKLDNVGINELGEGKFHYVGDLEDLYKNDFINFCKYNVQDVRIMVLIENKLRLIDLAIGIRTLAKGNYEDIFHNSHTIDNMCLMKINHWRDQGKDWVLPSKPTVVVKKDFIGAYVKETLKGRYKWVMDLDYKSEYPSEYCTWGLSTESMVGMIDNFQDVMQKSFKDFFPELNEKEIYDHLMPNFGPFNPSDDVVVKPTPLYSNIKTNFDSFEEFRSWCIENEYTIMANGLIVDSKIEEPFIGSLAGYVMDLRDEYKKLMKEYDSTGNEEMAKIYDILQKAVKTINNSIYGVTSMGAFRLFDMRLAEAITATGQCIIKSSIYSLNNFMNELMLKKNPNHVFKDIVITSDTDSIIFTAENLIDTDISCDDVEELKRIVKEMSVGQEKVNKEIRKICKNVFFIPDVETNHFRMYIKNEWLASSGLFLAKKGYALNIVFKEGYPKKDFKVAGLTLKKSSTPKAMQEFLSKIVKKVLSYEAKSEIDSDIMTEAVKIKSYPLFDIASPTGVNGIDTYLSNTPIHVRGAKVFNKYFAKNISDRINSDKVKYLYVKEWLTEKNLNLNKEYVISIPTNKQEYWEKLSEWVVPDYDKMREKLIKTPIEKIYTALNWSVPNISRADIKSSFSGLDKYKKAKKS